MNKPSQELGFTLLEILIALAVFAVMSMMAYSGLAAILKAKESTNPRSAQMAQLQTTWYFFNEDLEQVVDRPIRDELGSTEPAFGIGRGNEVLVFTRKIPAWKSRTANNTLQRVSYRFEDSALYRYSWTLLDRTPETQARRRLLINTNSVDIKSYDEDSQSWLPFSGINRSIPKALEISLSLPQLGIIRHSFLVHQ